jgi:histidinol phosphatase-like enzyme
VDLMSKYAIDIDGTICKEEGKVIGRKPYKDRIEKINKLYDEGHN